MLTTDDVFLADLDAHPDDWSTRLIYADWLDEHNRPALAEVLRIDYELSLLADRTDAPGADRKDVLRRRLSQLRWRAFAAAGPDRLS